MDSEFRAPLIEAKDICKIYDGTGSRVSVLNQVSLIVERGELVVVTGISGSGKSTLLNILGCLDRPSAGKLILDGLDTETLTRDQLAILRGERIGFVFQQSHLVRHMTALENVLFPFTLGECRIDKKRGLEVLDAVGLNERAHHRPSELSGGEQQRVAIARALVRQPDIVLADEPTGSLDRKTGTEIAELLTGLVEGKRQRSVIIVTHQPELIAGPRRQVVLADGRLASASFAELADYAGVGRGF
ncbi:MAG: ABC transporter ATP-binding protein [Pyrinomonadaceae bacterium]